MADKFNMCHNVFWRMTFIAVLAGYVGIIFGEMNSTIENQSYMNDSEQFWENNITENKMNLTNTTLNLIHKSVMMICDKFNYPENGPKVLVEVLNFFDCLSPFLDFETLKSEITEAKQNSSKLDGMIGKYCVNAPELKICLHGLLLGLLPCTPAVLREYEYLAENASYSAIEWACSDNGTRVERFIEEDGRMCIQEQIPKAMECMNGGNASTNASTSAPSLRTNNNMTLIKKCAKIDVMMQCNINKLEACPSNITAEIATSLLGYIRGMSPCRDIAVNLDQDWEYEIETPTYNITEATTEPSVMSREL